MTATQNPAQDVSDAAIAAAFREFCQLHQLDRCVQSAPNWINTRARELQQAQVAGERCERCGDSRRVLVGPRSFGEVTSIPCPECNPPRDDYITLAEVESRLETLAEEYEWCDDESPHTITDGERAILIDFAHGILVDDMFLAMMEAHYDPNSRGRPDKATPQSSAPVVGEWYVVSVKGGDFDSIPISMFGQPAIFQTKDDAEKFCEFAQASGLHEVRKRPAALGKGE